MQHLTIRIELEDEDEVLRVYVKVKNKGERAVTSTLEPAAFQTNPARTISTPSTAPAAVNAKDLWSAQSMVRISSRESLCHSLSCHWHEEMVRRFVSRANPGERTCDSARCCHQDD